MKTLRRIALSFLVTTLCAAGTASGAEEPPPDGTEPPAHPARLRVSGMGLLGNRIARATLREVQAAPESPVFDAGFVEDSILILRNRAVDDGYMAAQVTADLTLEAGKRLVLWWTGDEELEIPRNLRVLEARFRVIRGPLHFYESITITGVHAIEPDRAEAFLVARDSLLQTRDSKRFSPSLVQRSLSRLRSELENLGHRDATVELGETVLDPGSGAVRVSVRVHEGPRYRVAALELTPVAAELDSPIALPANATSTLFSPTWQQDATQFITRQWQTQGYADARGVIREVGRETVDGEVHLRLRAEVTPGDRIALGAVRFEGGAHTRTSFLERRTRMEGPWLDRIEADRARERLARLGSFKFVETRLDPPEGSPRDVVFDLTEGRRYEVNLIAGYGSYDQLFGGLEFDHHNLWGVGHNSRFRGVQSFKSTQLGYAYIVPEFFQPDLGATASVDGFRREELTFDRQELKLGVGLRRAFPGSGHQVGLRYAYQFLDSANTPVTAGRSATEAAAIFADWELDQRDNPLLPTRGTRFFTTLEYANAALGGRSEYTRAEIGGSAHVSFARGLILHAGVQHGVVAGPDRTTDLPFNKRFFPGGENSVRGFQVGGASPVNAAGDQLGAESYLQWNIELEQRIVQSISIVTFVDGVGVTPLIENYPFDEVLWSAGGGLRWNTLIGPVRLEYGYNLNPRSTDPEGTLQFSIGFPF